MLQITRNRQELTEKTQDCFFVKILEIMSEQNAAQMTEELQGVDILL